MSYLKELQEKIEHLEDVVDGQDLQIRVVENELVDVTTSSKNVSETTMILLGMMMELNQFVVKKGKHTEATLASKKRLLRLYELNLTLSEVTDKLYQLKSINRDLHAQYQVLRVKNKELNHQITQTQLAEEF